jgi:hypothetical protein
MYQGSGNNKLRSRGEVVITARQNLPVCVHSRNHKVIAAMPKTISPKCFVAMARPMVNVAMANHCHALVSMKRRIANKAQHNPSAMST